MQLNIFFCRVSLFHKLRFCQWHVHFHDLVNHYEDSDGVSYNKSKIMDSRFKHPSIVSEEQPTIRESQRDKVEAEEYPGDEANYQTLSQGIRG